MAQNILTQLVTLQQFNKILGHSLSTEEFKHYLQQVKFINPKVGKFWQGTDVQPGIYIAIAGKVRLLDSADELIATLKAGDSFGEFTLFKEGDFKPYAARASINLQLCFVLGEVLWPLMAKYPQIREHLWAKVLSRNPPQVDSENSLILPSDSKRLHETKVLSTPAVKPRDKKISKAYFPNSTQRVGHLLQRVIRRYPFFAQQSGADCGAACLVMVSRYWGKNFSVNRLRDIANVDRNGSSLRGLSAAAESIGFATRPGKASLDQLAKQKLPAIAHWEGKHYIVVYEITPKYVIVADPAIGQRTLSHAEFKVNWTGSRGDNRL
ncbi:Cyclic nucleotide-binding domain-containing protein [Nostoc sp. DSM 114167]|jgi:CRP-like cAMP-binding protein